MTATSGIPVNLTLSPVGINTDPDLANATDQLEQLPEPARKALYRYPGSRRRQYCCATTKMPRSLKSYSRCSCVLSRNSLRPNDKAPRCRPNLSTTFSRRRGQRPCPHRRRLEIGLGDVLDSRKSSRNFSNRPLSQTELSTLLHYAAGKRGVEAGYGIKEQFHCSGTRASAA